MIVAVSAISDGLVVERGNLAGLERFDPALYIVEEVSADVFPDIGAEYYRHADGSYHTVPE